MTPNLLLALQITAIGMALVFAAIILLWLMIILLTRFTANRDSAADSTKTADAAELDTLARAAAIGVAIAMAEQQISAAHPLAQPPTAIVSAWQLGMRTRQMTQKGIRIPKS
jgi:Na+-transporting methylmalonyl-CoA/oxaloacetate decarboxylase gamma subunit